MQAQTIKITLKFEGATAYTENVTALVLGNMIDPVSGVSWSTAPDGNNPWTWHKGSGNVNTFGLMANYKLSQIETTAFSQLVINPTNVPTGDLDVVAELSTAAIDGDKGNTVLRFKSVTVNGTENDAVAYVKDWGTDKPQPSSTFYN